LENPDVHPASNIRLPLCREKGDGAGRSAWKMQQLTLCIGNAATKTNAIKNRTMPNTRCPNLSISVAHLCVLPLYRKRNFDTEGRNALITLSINTAPREQQAAIAKKHTQPNPFKYNALKSDAKKQDSLENKFREQSIRKK